MFVTLFEPLIVLYQQSNISRLISYIPDLLYGIIRARENSPQEMKPEETTNTINQSAKGGSVQRVS